MCKASWWSWGSLTPRWLSSHRPPPPPPLPAPPPLHPSCMWTPGQRPEEQVPWTGASLCAASSSASSSCSCSCTLARHSPASRWDPRQARQPELLRPCQIVEEVELFVFVSSFVSSLHLAWLPRRRHALLATSLTPSQLLLALTAERYTSVMMLCLQNRPDRFFHLWKLWDCCHALIQEALVLVLSNHESPRVACFPANHLSSGFQ